MTNINRIKPIDGLRACAVMGVMWVHNWMFMGNHNLDICGIDLQRVISYVGVGVDLFFVISGFCMYLMFTNKYLPLTKTNFAKFVISRWKRIAPVYYIGILVYFSSAVFIDFGDSAISILLHSLFIQNYFNVQICAPHFWSICTEWQFYLLIPVYFILLKKHGAQKTNILFIIISLFSRLLYWRYFNSDFKDLKNTDFIILRLIEFNSGIIACQHYLKNSPLACYFKNAYGFILGFILSFIGRLCLTSETLQYAGSSMYIVRAIFTEPLMALGFALMLYNVIMEKSIFQKLLNSEILQQIGKVSYSMYIWHWIVNIYLVTILLPKIGFSFISQITIFITSLIFTYSLSVISYRYLELPYFKKSSTIFPPINNL